MKEVFRYLLGSGSGWGMDEGQRVEGKRYDETVRD